MKKTDVLQTRAFLFDMDGVLLPSVGAWQSVEESLYRQLFGEAIAAKIAQSDTVGASVRGVYDFARSCGADVEYDVYRRAYERGAETIYRTLPLTEGIDELVAVLIELGYRIGIVSASPMSWIQMVIERLDFAADIAVVVSLDERDDLEDKPVPDGYVEAMRLIGATPSTTIAIEDSNTGIMAAKNAGIYTIGFREHLPYDYVQNNADVSVVSLEEVITILSSDSFRLQG